MENQALANYEPERSAKHEVKHTAGPYSRLGARVLAPDGSLVAEAFHHGDCCAGENAEFIVRACNSYDQMVTALKAAQEFIRNGIEFGYIQMPDRSTPDSAHGTPKLIDAALALAKE